MACGWCREQAALTKRLFAKGEVIKAARAAIEGLRHMATNTAEEIKRKAYFAKKIEADLRADALRTKHAKPAADTQPKAASAAKLGKASAKAGRQAGKALPQHEQRRVEGDTPASAE